MSVNVDLFWSFRSPYSYLATPEALDIPKRFDVNLRFRPVLPLAVRQPGFFSPENLKRAKYILIDWPRRAEMLGLPHAKAVPRSRCPGPANVQNCRRATLYLSIDLSWRRGAAQKPGHTVRSGSVPPYLRRNPGLASGRSSEERRIVTGPAWISMPWSMRSRIPRPIRKRSKKIRQTWKNPATGAYRPSFSTMSRSSGRTESMPCAGDWRKKIFYLTRYRDDKDRFL